MWQPRCLRPLRRTYAFCGVRAAKRPRSIWHPLTQTQRLFAGYETWTEQALELLHCTPVGGTSVLAEHPDVECYGAEHRKLMTASVLIIAVVVIGLPMGMLVFLYRNTHRFEDAVFRGTNGVLYEHYNGGVQFWWQPQELLRRTVLIIVSVAASQRAALRSWLLGAVCLLILVTHVWYVGGSSAMFMISCLLVHGALRGRRK